MSNTTPDDHVRLALHHGSDLYLEVPIAVVGDPSISDILAGPSLVSQEIY